MHFHVHCSKSVFLRSCYMCPSIYISEATSIAINFSLILINIFLHSLCYILGDNVISSFGIRSIASFILVFQVYHFLSNPSNLLVTWHSGFPPLQFCTSFTVFLVESALLCAASIVPFILVMVLFSLPFVFQSKFHWILLPHSIFPTFSCLYLDSYLTETITSYHF